MFYFQQSLLTAKFLRLQRNYIIIILALSRTFQLHLALLKRPLPRDSKTNYNPLKHHPRRLIHRPRIR
jgi:hypothetical protein